MIVKCPNCMRDLEVKKKDVLVICKCGVAVYDRAEKSNSNILKGGYD
ncbi:MAG: hypothetical protein ACOC5T_04015 [Elusimicrobiota bacterium]